MYKCNFPIFSSFFYDIYFPFLLILSTVFFTIPNFSYVSNFNNESQKIQLLIEFIIKAINFHTSRINVTFRGFNTFLKFLSF